MRKTVVVRIEGSANETDAPTIDDMLAQLRDYSELLGIVEQTLAEDGQSAIQWRVTNAAKGSPLSFTLQAFARQYAVNVDTRANLIVSHVNLGLEKLRNGPERPRYFNDEAVAKAEHIFERVTNGLGKTYIESEGLPKIVITPTVARIATRNTQTLLTPEHRPYKEWGTVEGYVESVSLDGYGRRVLHLKSRLTGDDVKCFVSGDAEREISLREIGEIWGKRRISVTGTLHFKAPGKITSIDAVQVRFLRSRSELPDVSDIIDPDFTGGEISEEYLERLRNGETS